MKLNNTTPTGHLPEEPTRPLSWQQIAIMLASIMAFLLIVNAVAIVLLANTTPNLGYKIVRDKWSLLRAPQQPVDWLILGDSSCNQGVKPSIISSETGESVLNLCTTGSMLFVEDVWMLEEYIMLHGRPKHVLLVHVYDIWHLDDINLRQALWNISTDHSFFEELIPPVDFSIRQKAELRTAHLIPIFSQPTSLKHLIFTWIKPSDNALSFVQLDGYMPVYQSNLKNVQRDTASHLDFVKSHKASISKNNLEALAQLNNLAKLHDLDITIAMSPVHDKLVDDPNFKTYMTQLNSTLQDAMTDKNIHLHLSPAPFPAELLENTDHLIDSAADTYTKDLLRIIKTR